MEPWHIPVLAAVGILAGFTNVMAGGGSLLTMPLMIFMGFSPAAANGTNRVALLAQNAAAVGGFRKRGFSDFRLSLTLSLCTLPGSVAGALAAVWIHPVWFKRLLALVMIGVLVSLFRGRSPSAAGGEAGAGRRFSAHLGMVGVGFYGGFIQAGVGFLIMALLHGLLRLDLVRVNMHKVFVVGAYMVPSLAVFAWTGQVVWQAGFVLAAGNALGGWLGAHASIRGGEKAIRAIFAAAVAAMAFKLVIG